ncbi:MAG: hypothetical protein NXI08_13005 [bacterium]|nr:hypothetical protein [bacterium]
MRDESTKNFLINWESFLKNLSKLCEVQIKQRSEAYKELENIRQTIFKELTDRSKSDIKELINSGAHPDFSIDLKDDLMMVNLLTQEMKFFNRLIEFDQLNYVSQDDLDDATSAGKTIKDSIEDFLKKRKKKMPGWLDNILYVLNELLSLLKGG